MFVYCLFLECPLHGALTLFFRRDAALRLSAWDPAPEEGSMPSHLLNDSMSFPAVEETREAALCCGGGACHGPALGPAPRSNQLLPLFSRELSLGQYRAFPPSLPRIFCSCRENPERRNRRAAERSPPSRHLPNSPRRQCWACSVGRAASALGVGS